MTFYADMAELADAHGSGPCESDFMQVQVLLSAPKHKKSEPYTVRIFCYNLQHYGINSITPSCISGFVAPAVPLA